MTIDPRKLREIAEWLEANQARGYNTQTTIRNFNYLLGCVNALMSGHTQAWIDDAAKMAMQGLLASEVQFGTNLEEAAKRVAESAVRCAVELRGEVNRYLQEASDAKARETDPKVSELRRSAQSGQLVHPGQ